MSSMGIPIAIFVVCLSAGVIASSRWLPDLRAGPVGGLAFFLVCGLMGAALALAGLHIYSIVEISKNSEAAFGSRNFRAEFVASGLASMLWEVGSLVALATVVYLLAPSANRTDDPGRGPTRPAQRAY
jgi:predicted phage tail protein